MTYPKPIMSTKELAAMGIACDKTIRQWCHIPGNDFAFTIGGGRFRIDTEKFDKFYQSQIIRTVGGRHRR